MVIKRSVPLQATHIKKNTTGLKMKLWMYAGQSRFKCNFLGMAVMPIPLWFPKMKPCLNCPKPVKYHQKYHFYLKVRG